MLESLWNFLNRYFWEPMFTRSGYNAVNTFVYALLFGLAVIYSYRYIIKPLKIRVDDKLFWITIPIVIFGATVRALVDGGLLPKNPLLLTPGIFFTASAFVVPAIVADAKLKTYPRITVGWGTILALWANYQLVTHARDWRPYGLTLLHTAVSWAIVLGFYRLKPFDRLYLYPVLAHYFDVASTVVAIHFYGYYEVHWIEHQLVDWFGAYVYYPWITVILIAVYYALKYLVPDENERHFWYLAIYVLGLGPAIRDPAQLVLQV